MISKISFERYKTILANSIKRKLFGVSQKHNIKYLTYELTNECNSKCGMCNIWANKPSDNLLKTTEIENFFDDPALKNLEEVILTGGEMFMRDDIFEIIKKIHSINGKTIISVSTNGILFSKILEVAKKLVKSQIPVNYGISLDGIGLDHDKRRRVKDNFNLIDKKLIPGLKKLAVSNPGLITISIGHCLDEYGSKTFHDVLNYCKKNDLSFMTQLIEDFDYYLPEKKQTKTSNNWNEIHLFKKGIDGNNRLLKKDIYQTSIIDYTKFLSFLPRNIHHYRLVNYLNNKSKPYECSSFRNFFLLKYDGEVTPCLRFSTKSLGNIKKDSLTNILDSHVRQEAVSEILKCEGCLNTWCTEWSMQENIFPFYREAIKVISNKVFKRFNRS